ncbi:MAG: hypothetical protein ABI905_01995 [Betaproteobacteria bacterium]
MNKTFLMFAFTSFAILAAPPPALAAADIECRMSIPARVHSPAGARANIPLTFELANKTKKTYNILNWDTPFEGFYGPYLQITGPGGEVEYRGKVVKRGPPTREEYVSIKKGDRRAITINIAPAYDFKAPGKYEIVFDGKLFDATTEKIPRTNELRTATTVECAPVSFELLAGK